MKGAMKKEAGKKEGEGVTHADLLAKYGAEALDFPDCRPGVDDPKRNQRIKDMIEARLRAEQAEQAAPKK